MRHRLILLVVGLHTLTSVIWPASSGAVNWEGHDEWFHDNTLFDAFMEGVPSAIKKPKPSCAFMRERHAANTYEQTPLPGKNCVGDVLP
jgi:hypothetical protein